MINPMNDPINDPKMNEAIAKVSNMAMWEIVQMVFVGSSQEQYVASSEAVHDKIKRLLDKQRDNDNLIAFLDALFIMVMMIGVVSYRKTGLGPIHEEAALMVDRRYKRVLNTRLSEFSRILGSFKEQESGNLIDHYYTALLSTYGAPATNPAAHPLLDQGFRMSIIEVSLYCAETLLEIYDHANQVVVKEI